MIYKFSGTSHHRALVLWKYYMRLATRSTHINRASYWLKLAKWAIDGQASWFPSEEDKINATINR